MAGQANRSGRIREGVVWADINAGDIGGLEGIAGRAGSNTMIETLKGVDSGGVGGHIVVEEVGLRLAAVEHKVDGNGSIETVPVFVVLRLDHISSNGGGPCQIVDQKHVNIGLIVVCDISSAEADNCKGYTAQYVVA